MKKRTKIIAKRRVKKVDYSSYKPTLYLKRSIAQSKKEYAEGKYKVFHSVAELEKDLMS